MANKGSYLVNGKYLAGGDWLVSPNGQYLASMQDDGNFVLYYSNDPTKGMGKDAYWATNTAADERKDGHAGPYVAVLGDNGNFTLYFGSDPTVITDKDAYWATNISLGTDQYVAMLQDDGNFVISHGSDPAHPGEIIWSALPDIFVQCKFMQNYRETSPVNGGKSVVAVRNARGDIELFTVGSDKEVHTFSPDPASETGYSEAVITHGLQATLVAVGLDSNGKVIIFAASGLSLSYIVETNDSTSRWSAPQTINTFVPITGATRISDIVVQEIAGDLYVAVTQAMNTGQYFVVYSHWQTALEFLKAPMGPYPGDPHCYFQGNSAQNVTLVIYLSPGADKIAKLCFYPLATQKVTTASVNLALTPISVDTALDASGANQIFAILEDHQAYTLQRGPDQNGVAQYNWVPLWQVEPNDPDAQKEKVPFQEVVVEADDHGAVQVFTVSQAVPLIDGDPTAYNFLYHWTPLAGSATGYVSPPFPIHKSSGMQLGGVSNGQGSIDVFAVDSANFVTHLFQEQASSDWSVQAILDPANANSSITEYSSYATDITVYDSVRALAIGVPAKIWASEEARITVNGATYFIDAHRRVQVLTNGSGILSISQQTDSLASPFLEVSLPTLTLANAPSIVIQPFVDVQDQLTKTTADDLMNATIMDENGNVSYLLDDEHRTPENTKSLAAAIGDFMGDVTTPTLMAATPGAPRNRNRNRFWSRSSLPASELRRIIPHRQRHAWQLSFEGNRVIHRPLTAHEAATLRAEKLQTLPSLDGTLGSWWSKIGDALRSVVDGIAKVANIIYDGIQATIDLVINGVNYVFNALVEFIDDAFNMVEMIFAQIKVFFEKLYEWLAWLFAWKYILRTKDALAYTINQMLDFLNGSAAGLQTLVDDGFRTIQNQIDSLFDQAVNNIAGQSTLGGYEQSNAQPDPDADEATSNNFFYNEFLNNSSSSSVSASLQAFVASDPVNQFAQQLADFTNTIEGSDAFGDALGYFQNLGGSPDNVFRMLLAGMLRVVQGLLKAGISLVNSLVNSLLQLMQTIIGSIQSILNEAWNIPFVSTFYSWVTKGDTLTAISLVSLILAIPTTIFYKLTTGANPFPNETGPDSVADFKQSFDSGMMLQAAGLAKTSGQLMGTPAITLSPMAAKVLAGAYLVSTFCGGVLTMTIDQWPFPPVQAKGWRVYINYLCTFASLGFQFPWFFTEGDLNCLNQVGIENWFYIALCLTVALSLYIDNYGFALPTVPNDTMAIAMTAAGGFNLIMASLASVNQPDARKVAWRIIMPIPMMAKFLRLTMLNPNPAFPLAVAALGTLDIWCNTTAAVLGFLVLKEGN